MKDTLTRYQRFTFIKLKKDYKTMKDVEAKILNNRFKAQMKGKTFDENNPETYFEYYWSDNISSSINLPTGNGASVSCRKIEACCEYSTRKIYEDNERTRLLPKEKRLKSQRTTVFFLEHQNMCFVAICSFDTYELLRVKKLIGFSNFEPLTQEYQITSELFMWLFYKYITKDAEISDSIEILKMTGFTGNVLSEENNFNGNGNSVTDLVITKAFLANNYQVIAIEIDLTVDETPVNFVINQVNNEENELRVMVLNGSGTSVLLNSADIEDLMPAYMLFVVIPKISESYQNSCATFEKNKNKFHYDFAIEVIKNIMSKNRITKEKLMDEL